MKISPMMRHYLQLKEKYADCIVFYRLGDFYEMFYDDAVTCSRELELTLTGKNCGLDDRAPMCGVPHHAYETYVAKLIGKGYKVAICEQLTEAVEGSKDIVERDVVRIITPGTLMDSSMLTDCVNNFIMCIYKSKNQISYAYTDISTGEFYCSSYDGPKCLEYINDQIVRIAPAEIICNLEMQNMSNQLVCMQGQEKLKFQAYYDWAFFKANATESITKQYGLNSILGYDFSTDALIAPIGALLTYLKETQKREMKHLFLPKILTDEQFMYVDMNTRRNLEIEQSMREHSKYGSLLWVLDKTSTSAGARMLRNWIKQPLQSKTEIEKRLNLLTILKNNNLHRQALTDQLKQIQDIGRLMGKISYGSISPRDCLALLYSVEKTPKIKQILASLNTESFLPICNDLVDLSEMCHTITITIDENCPALIKEGNYIKSGFNAELDKYRDLSHNAKGYILKLEQQERESTGIKNLKIGYNKVFGYYIEVNKQYEDKVPFRYIRKQTISNNERYITEELKNFENDVISSEEKTIKLETEIFSSLKQYLMNYCTELQRLANAIAYVDCLVSLTTVAIENNYCKPNINTQSKIEIVGGRHPVVEKCLKQNEFITNDTCLDNQDNRTMILTGPNMAGKSTYMRQVALITYMAHIGSYVPADSADICIVDRIFTRVGASDDLAVGQSTFMVEMIEVSNILQNATNNSLIIFDEVGRGTSTYDGLSIAQAVVEFVCNHLKAKTLFATHYHELTELEGILDGVKNYSIAIKELNGKLVFLRKIMRGGAKRSYGVEVASLAGLPNEIILRAKALISQLEEKKNIVMQNEQVCEKTSAVENIIKDLKLETMSPLVAFETLISLQEMLNKEK